jgi:hypothetical protein
MALILSARLDGKEKMGRIAPQMTVLEVIYRYRQTEKVFRKYDAAAGVCLCCQALFDSLADLARKYDLKLDQLLADLELAAEEGET